MTERLICDVSGYQRAVDFVQAKRWSPELSGVIIKATEGQWFNTNPFFEQQYASARAAGLPVGFYCFDHTSVDPSLQAELYVQKIAGKPAELGHWFDFEANDGGLPPAAVQNRIGTWFAEVGQARPEMRGVYSAAWAWDPWTGRLDASRYPLWLAGYTEQIPASPAHWGGPLMWQFTDSYRFYFGACDASVFLGTDTQWETLIGGSNPVEDDMTPQQDALLKEIGLLTMQMASRQVNDAKSGTAWQQTASGLIAHGGTGHYGLDQTGQDMTLVKKKLGIGPGPASAEDDKVLAL